MLRTASDTSLRILLVDDNVADVHLVAEVLDRIRTPTTLSAVKDGFEALKFLRRQGAHSEAPRPHVVWLDLKLPRKDGHDVLREIRDDAELADLPVIILSSSDSEYDVQQSYDLHANCHVVKRVDFTNYARSLEALVEFWAMHASIPGRGN